MNVLIVDDHMSNLKLLRYFLEGEGHTVRDARDGIEALALLNREAVEAVISDVLMPNMDGFRLCLEIRKHPRFYALPFIFYTSTYNSSSDRRMAMDAGGDAFLDKPAADGLIRQALAEAVEKAEGRLKGPAASHTGDVDIIKQYNAALVSKLEDRNLELEGRNAGLRAIEERRVQALKAEVNQLLAQLHRPPRYGEEEGKGSP